MPIRLYTPETSDDSLPEGLRPSAEVPNGLPSPSYSSSSSSFPSIGRPARSTDPTLDRYEFASLHWNLADSATILARIIQGSEPMTSPRDARRAIQEAINNLQQNIEDINNYSDTHMGQFWRAMEVWEFNFFAREKNMSIMDPDELVRPLLGSNGRPIPGLPLTGRGIFDLSIDQLNFILVRLGLSNPAVEDPHAKRDALLNEMGLYNVLFFYERLAI